MVRRLVLVGLLWLVLPGGHGLPSPAVGQQLSVERIFGSEEFEPRSYDVTWLPEGARYGRLVSGEAGVTEVWRADAVTGDSVKLVSAAELTPPGRSTPISIEAVDFARGGDRLLLFADAERVWRDRTRGAYYVFDVPTRRLLPVGPEPGGQMFAKFSPDGERVAFVRGGDLYLFAIEAGTLRRLTHDGGGPVTNGTADWLYEEELGLRDGFRWSPDGNRIAFWRFDRSPVPVFELYDSSTLYPEMRPIRYPKAGEANSGVRLGTIDLESGDVTWLDVSAGSEAYLPWMEWAHSSEELLVQRINRRQDRLDVLLGDAVTGRTRLLFSEQSGTWLEAGRPVTWTAGGEAFLWPSDRSGFRHLYLYGRDGQLRRQVTEGAWDVTSMAGLDTIAAVVYFTAAAESPMTRAVMSADLDGSGEARTLVGGRGMRSVSFAPDHSVFIEKASTIAEPPTFTLRRHTGEVVRVIEDNGPLSRRLDRLGLREPEFIDLPGADGTRLNAWIMKPRDFDPTRAYPLLLYAYGGPGSQTVVDGWGGDRYLWHQMLVDRGILVASVDNRGTGGRGRAFTDQVYLRLGQLESADQLAAARDLSARPYVDRGRVGIWGWSYGGYLALMSALRSDGELTAAVAVAPVTDWKYYDTAYTERFMRTPAENPEGYRRGAPARQAERLRSELLLAHGTGDDNVHPQHTTAMVDALIEAGRPFDLALYPNRTHSLSGSATRVHLFERITRFLDSRLLTGPSPVRPAEPVPARLGLGLLPD